MKAHAALIMWTPSYWLGEPDSEPGSHPMAGRAKVVPYFAAYGDYMRQRGFELDLGTRLRDYSGPELLAMLFIEFSTLVARDGVDVQVAHREFLKIDEYRWVISRDAPGAEDRPESFYWEYWPVHCAKET